MTKTIDQLNAEIAALAVEIKFLKAQEKLQNEGGEGYCYWESKAEQQARLEYERDSILFAQEWTPEVTTARRAQWNAEMQKLIAAKQQATTRVLTEISSRLGFNMSDLTRAIRINNL